MARHEQNFDTDGKLTPYKTMGEVIAALGREQFVDILTDMYYGKLEVFTGAWNREDARQKFLKFREDNRIVVLDVKRPIVSRGSYSYPLSNKVILFRDWGSGGNLSLRYPLDTDPSNYFQIKNRIYARVNYHNDSIAEIILNRDKLRRYIHQHMSSSYVNNEPICAVKSGRELRSVATISMTIPSKFKPYVAKAVYEYFDSKDILDFCAGWGDRLCGFYATRGAKSYIGIDPNTAVYNTYFEQAKAYQEWIDAESTDLFSIPDKKRVTFINKPAEDVTLPPESVDTVFTSPPYFDLEIYSKEDTQSTERYNTLDSWLDGFLKPALKMAYTSLKPNGVMVINISDYKNIKMCDPMNDYLRDLGMTFEGTIGMFLTSHNKSKVPDIAEAINNNAIMVEPIWIWRKQNVS